MCLSLRQIEEMGYGIETLKDASFDSLCNVTSKTKIRCLSYAIDKSFLRRACREENIAAILVPYDFKDDEELLGIDRGIAISKNPKYDFYQLHNDLTTNRDKHYYWEEYETTIGNHSNIHKSAIIADKNVKIGNNVTIEENVIIREGVEIGDNVRIMSGAIIGYDSCMSAKDLNGNYMPLLSAGRVKIANCVWIGCYSYISRGLFPYEVTCIGDYSKIGPSVDISHNVQIGKNVLVLGHCVVCGNTVIKDNAHLSPRSVISNRIRVEEDADVAIGSVVVSNVEKGMRVAGNYAIENDKFLRWHRKKLKVNPNSDGT